MEINSVTDCSTYTTYHYNDEMLKRGFFIEVTEDEGEEREFVTHIKVFYKNNDSYGWFTLSNSNLMSPAMIETTIVRLAKEFSESPKVLTIGDEKFIEFLGTISIEHTCTDDKEELKDKSDIVDEYVSRKDFIEYLITL